MQRQVQTFLTAFPSNNKEKTIAYNDSAPWLDCRHESVPIPAALDGRWLGIRGNFQPFGKEADRITPFMNGFDAAAKGHFCIGSMVTTELLRKPELRTTCHLSLRARFFWSFSSLEWRKKSDAPPGYQENGLASSRNLLARGKHRRCFIESLSV